MDKYNSAFFNLYENWFKVLRYELGETKALSFFKKVMETSLSQAYGDQFRKGEINDFITLVGNRDDAVGLKIEFQTLSPNQFKYIFYTDPFPNLKNEISHIKIDDTYMPFKIQHLLGDDWSFRNIKHLWKGDTTTEFLIFKSTYE